MIKIPTAEKRYSQPNTSDLFGNIWYTKNINLDEEGYAKLSSRVVSFKSEEDDGNFDIPISFGRGSSEFHIVSADSAYDISLTESNFSITEDVSASNPTLTFDSWGKWFQNRWHAATATGIFWETSTGGGWTAFGGTALTSGFVHTLEVFRNKNSLAVSNGNTVRLLDTSYATTVTLTIPAGFEVIALSYNNNKMAVATMPSDTAAGQNQGAFLFIWDGASTSAGQGYGVGSDTIMGVAAYKSSWVILTRTGELKYFNGGGFETLATLPFYFKQTVWGDSQNRETHGDMMSVEGDVIYINIGNSLSVFGRKGESYLQNHVAGVLCYDPKVGLYHRYSPSITPANQILVTSANVNTTTNVLTTANSIPATGNPIKLVSSASAPIGGLSIGKVYFIIKLSATTFSVATTKALALLGTAVDITSTGAANNYFTALTVLDYGTTKMERSGGIGIVETPKAIADHLLFGGELRDSNSTTDYATLNITVPGFENRGYLVTARSFSNAIEDNLPKAFIKHRPLDVADKIILKYKNIDILGIPTSTTQHNVGTTNCSWTSASVFTTTSDLSDVKNYLDADTTNECEVEIISGAGAGSMAQISSLTETGGTYTVTLAEDVDGAAASSVCDVSIDNWKLLKTTNGESYISSTNTRGWEEFPIATASKSVLFKIEFRGSETTMEEFLVPNSTQLPSE